MSGVRTRFAPSPTGYLHVGGLRTALYNYLFARREGGKFILRIEDTDQNRKVEGATESLIKTLDWAGVCFDEGPGRDGECGPYIQSQRIELYQQHAQQLVEQGQAYFCFCTPDRLKTLREEQAAAKLSSSYDRHCRDLPADEVNERLKRGDVHVIRMKVPLSGTLTFNDRIRGEVSIGFENLDDQVIMKSDGFPTYHLAVVVDDHFMKISHIIRGEEWLPSTPKHILLYQYFGWEIPQFAHLPLLLNPDRSKLSKRQGDVAVEEYRSKGYLKEALINFVTLLGWNPGDEREIFTIDELVKEFSLERVGKSGAIFNREKLDWLNFEHLRRKPDTEVLVSIRDHLSKTRFNDRVYEDDYLLKIIAAMRERASFVQDFVDKCPYFYGVPEQYEAETVRKRWKPESHGYLIRLREEFDQLSNPHKEDFETALHRTAELLNIKNSELIHPLRLAVSGTGVGPGLFDILEIIGKDETIHRITSALEKIR